MALAIVLAAQMILTWILVSGQAENSDPTAAAADAAAAAVVTQKPTPVDHRENPSSAASAASAAAEQQNYGGFTGSGGGFPGTGFPAAGSSSGSFPSTNGGFTGTFSLGFPGQQQPSAGFPSQQQPSAGFPGQQQPLPGFPGQQQPSAGWNGYGGGGSGGGFPTGQYPYPSNGGGMPPQGYVPGTSSGFPGPQPPEINPAAPRPPSDAKDLATSLLNDPTTFDVFLVGADGTMVGASSLILMKISDVFRRMIEEARMAAGGGGGGGGGIPTGNGSMPLPMPGGGGVPGSMPAGGIPGGPGLMPGVPGSMPGLPGPIPGISGSMPGVPGSIPGVSGPNGPMPGLPGPMPGLQGPIISVGDENAPREASSSFSSSSLASLQAAPSMGEQVEPDVAAPTQGGAPTTPAPTAAVPGVEGGAFPTQPPFVVLRTPFEVSTETLKRFVRFLYVFEVDILDANMRQELLFLANFFDVPSLKNSCRAFMSQRLSSRNVFLFLEEALNGRVEAMVEECLGIVEVDRRLFAADSTFNDVTLQQLERILTRERLPLTEEQLFRFVTEWTKRRGVGGGPQLETVFKLIRFPTMPPEFLANVVAFSRVLPDFDLVSVFADALSTPPAPKFGIYSSEKRQLVPVVSVAGGQLGNFTIEFKEQVSIADLRRDIVKVGGIQKEGFILFDAEGRPIDESLTLRQAGIEPNEVIILRSMITITVRPVSCAQCNGGPWKLQIRESENVIKVKEMLSENQGIPSSRINLRFSGENLLDTTPVSFYGIVHGSQVQLFVKSLVIGSVNVAVGGSAKASSVWGNPYLPEKAFEGTRNAIWVSKQMKNVPFESQWIQYSLPSSKTVGRLTFQGTIWQRQLPTGPTKYLFQGSKDESAWETLFQEDNGPEWKRTSEERDHVIKEPKEFKHYRILVTQTEWVRSGNYGRHEDYAVEIRNVRFFEAKLE